MNVIEEISRERKRQVEMDGWSAEGRLHLIRAIALIIVEIERRDEIDQRARDKFETEGI